MDPRLLSTVLLIRWSDATPVAPFWLKIAPPWDVALLLATTTWSNVKSPEL